MAVEREIEELDSRETLVSAKQLDELVLRATKTSEAVETIKKTALPLWGLIVLVFGIGVACMRFYAEWDATRNVGSPAMQSLEDRLSKQINAVRSIGDDRSDKLDVILAQQQTTNALLTQRIDQAEKRIERLEEGRR